jgi:subtilase-type serine protease
MADSNLLGGLADSTKAEARKTIASLANDIHVTANAMTIANGQSLVREIKDQAIGIDGSARVAEVDGGRARCPQLVTGRKWTVTEHPS